MAANTSPIFTLTPVVAQVRIATANTGRDGSGTLNTIKTGATNGSRIDKIRITAQGTTTAGMVRFFIDDGTNKYLWREVPVTANAPTGSAQSWTATITSDDPNLPLLVLPSTYILKCAPNNAETFDVIAHGGDF